MGDASEGRSGSAPEAPPAFDGGVTSALRGALRFVAARRAREVPAMAKVAALAAVPRTPGVVKMGWRALATPTEKTEVPVRALPGCPMAAQLPRRARFALQ